MRGERPRAEPDRVTPSYAIGAWKNLVIWVVDGHTPLEELERLRARVSDWNRARGGAKNVALIVLHAARSTMSAEERRSVARMIDESKHTRAASATVVLADGVLGALHRSILTGISMLVPAPHPTKVFADVERAIAFLEPHIARNCGEVRREDVAAMVADLHLLLRQAKLEAEGAAR